VPSEGEDHLGNRVQDTQAAAITAAISCALAGHLRQHRTMGVDACSRSRTPVAAYAPTQPSTRTKDGPPVPVLERRAALDRSHERRATHTVGRRGWRRHTAEALGPHGQVVALVLSIAGPEARNPGWRPHHFPRSRDLVRVLGAQASTVVSPARSPPASGAPSRGPHDAPGRRRLDQAPRRGAQRPADRNHDRQDH